MISIIFANIYIFIDIFVQSNKSIFVDINIFISDFGDSSPLPQLLNLLYNITIHIMHISISQTFSYAISYYYFCSFDLLNWSMDTDL